MSTKTCSAPLNLKKISKVNARILIAKDVLARIRYRQVVSGYYMDGVSFVRDDVLDNYYDKVDNGKNLDYSEELDAHKHTLELEKSCQVCALGNMMLSHIRLFDKIHLDDLEDHDRVNITRVLADYFDEEQLNLIELAFEGNSIICIDTNTEDRKKADSYHKKYPDIKKRLRSIMVNIVKNNGTFVPTDFRTKEEREYDAVYND